MKMKSVPSLYRYCIVRLSTVATSILRPALKVLSTTLPVSTCFNFVRTNAGPLPGLTCWNSTTFHSWLSSDSVMPFFRSFVVATDANSLIDWNCILPPDGWVSNAGENAQGQSVRIQTEARDGAAGDRRHHRRVPELFAGRRIAEVHLDQRGSTHRNRVAQRVGVVRERRRIEDDGRFVVGSLVKPADQAGLVVGLAHLNIETELATLSGAGLDQIVVALRSVDGGLATAQSGKIRPVQ